MMGFLLSLFTSKSTWIILAAVALMAFIGIQQARISHLKNKIEDKDAAIVAAQAELKQAQSLVLQFKNAYDGLSDTVDRQNAEITKLETAVAIRIAKAREAMRLAEIARAKAESLAESINLMELAKDECTALRQLVDSYTAGSLQ